MAPRRPDRIMSVIAVISMGCLPAVMWFRDVWWLLRSSHIIAPTEMDSLFSRGATTVTPVIAVSDGTPKVVGIKHLHVFDVSQTQERTLRAAAA